MINKSIFGQNGKIRWKTYRRSRRWRHSCCWCIDGRLHNGKRKMMKIYDEY